MSKVDEDFKEFIDNIKEYEPKSKAETIPEVFGIQYKEVYITKWIAYLLKQNFGYLILNVLLKAANSGISVSENEKFKVYTEYVFDTGRRIDILIFTDKYLIGIENKIWSGEQENQTEDYLDSMEIIKKDRGIKQIKGIYLHPEQNEAKSENFENVTYTQLYDGIKAQIPDSSDDFAKMMFKEFLKYVKECLYMSNGAFPKISPNVMLYAQYINTIQEIESAHSSECNAVIDWLEYMFKSKGYVVLKSGKGYMQLAPNDCSEKWEKIGFHFEILWGPDFMVGGKIKVEAHLEYLSDKKGFCSEIKSKFELDSDIERGAKKALASQIIEGLFESESEAEAEATSTFNQIIKKLKESNEFQDYAKKANAVDIGALQD